MVTQAKVNTLKILKKASKENDAPIWAKVADFVQKSRSNQKIVNLTRINQTTEDGNAVVITGKILGTGNISHKVSVSSFSNISLSKTPNKPKFDIPVITVPIIITSAKIPNSSWDISFPYLYQ